MCVLYSYFLHIKIHIIFNIIANIAFNKGLKESIKTANILCKILINILLRIFISSLFISIKPCKILYTKKLFLIYVFFCSIIKTLKTFFSLSLIIMTL